MELEQCQACDEPEMSWIEIQDDGGKSNFVYAHCNRCGFQGPSFEKMESPEPIEDYLAAQAWNEIQAQLKAAKRLEKARAVLAEHKRVVTFAKRKSAASLTIDKIDLVKCVADLADALGGGQGG